MISRIQSECKKLENLSNKEIVEFLISNNTGMDKEAFEMIRQMVFSQIHLDEHVQFLCDRKTFFTILKDIRSLNFERLDSVLRTSLQDSEEVDQEELRKYLEQFKTEEDEEAYRTRDILKSKIEQSFHSISTVSSAWDNKKKYEEEKKTSNDELAEVRKKLEEVKQKLKGKSIFSRIRDMIFDRQNRKCFKTEKETLQDEEQRLLARLQKLDAKLEEVDKEYKTPEELKAELMKSLDIASHIAVDNYSKRKLTEMLEHVREDTDFEGNVMSYYPQIMQAFWSMDGNSDAIYDMNQAFRDIGSQFRMTAGIFDETNMQSPDLLSLVTNIRKQMIHNAISSDHVISSQYRTKSLGKSRYITGTNYTQEQITESMNELNEEFERLKANSNDEEYIRGCADIFQKFLMIHPFADGNGRTSRIMLTVMLAQRGIFIPNVFDNYFERDSNSKFMRFGDEVAQNGNYKLFQDYLLERVQRYNPGVVQGDFSYLDDVYQELLKKERRDVRQEYFGNEY